MTTQNLLVELLVEELPPKSLKKSGEVFGALLFEGLKKLYSLEDDAQLTTFVSPRRLAAHITNVMAVAAQKPVEIKLMPVSIGLSSDGKPTPALLKKLHSLGLEYLTKVDVSVWKERVSQKSDGKVDCLFHTDTAAGLDLGFNLQKVLHDVISKLPIAKAMTYQLADGWSSVSFVRPAHGLVALYGREVVRSVIGPVEVLGLTAGRTTQGHRFEAANATLEIREADSYEAQMETEGAVIASFAKRHAEIARQLASVATQEGLHVIQDEALLDEVTGLVERPNVLLGQFEKEFLEVPPECLILTMKANQKYFPLINNAGKLTNKFLIVSNIAPADPSAVIHGNERVVRPRLADAKFFFDKDRKRTLGSRVTDLDKVVYHNKLGSQGERTQRVRAIAKAIAQKLDSDALVAQADQAAMLAKADLLTDMVGEFPELQGIMGRYYAKHDGLSDDIAFAIEGHYKPRFAGDELPRNLVGICVALADKLETLVGMFNIGQSPTGDRDPFALRRHALGVIRMLIEKKLSLDVDGLLRAASKPFGFLPEENIEAHLAYNRVQLANFIFERLAYNLREQGYSAQEVDAVVSLRPQRLSDVPKRLAAVREFSTLPEAAALAIANKRVKNILRKEFIEAGEGSIISKLLQEPAEQALHQALSQIAPKADAAFNTGDYTGSLQALAALRVPVDAFFDNVMVNVEDTDLRNNRLALLSQLQQAMNRVADISKLAA